MSLVNFERVVAPTCHLVHGQRRQMRLSNGTSAYTDVFRWVSVVLHNLLRSYPLSDHVT